MKKEIKLEWCKNWIKKTFEKLPIGITGVEVGCFWKLAEKSKLWIRGTYGTAMSEALSELIVVETVQDEDGKFLFDIFKLK